MGKYYSHIECAPSATNWIEAYLAVIPGLVEKHGGRYLYRSTEFESVEMPAEVPTTFMVLIEWPDAQAAAAMYADPDYQQVKAARHAGSETRWFNVAEYDGALV